VSRSLRLALGILAGGAPALLGQGYRLRLESRFQSVSFRGLEPDSVPASAVVIGPNGGPVTADGFAVDCPPGDRFCRFYRPGDKLRGLPWIQTADLTLWGLGVSGLSFRASARVAADLGSGDVWPGTDPALMLVEGYAEYTRPRWAGRLGRQFATGRLGYQGFDGARATLRLAGGDLDLSAYGGWGLARGTALPVTSPVLNPLDDFQPRDRQLVAGAEAGFRHRWLAGRAEYRREVDPTPDYLVSERASVALDLTPIARWRLSGGAEYDFANGWWGTSDATLGYSADRLAVSGTIRRYRPFFDLWTIWGAFSPVPYRSVGGTVMAAPAKRVWLRGTVERYWFDEVSVESPLVSVEDRGWRASAGATVRIGERWTVDGGVRGEFGPGASGRSVEGSVGYRPSDRLFVQAHAGALDRPLEFRFDDASLSWYGVVASLRLTDRWQLDGDLSRYVETRDRPDAARLDWNQLRLNARIVTWLGSKADRLPPAVRPVGRRP
jgi:hypothetical protein